MKTKALLLSLFATLLVTSMFAQVSQGTDAPKSETVTYYLTWDVASTANTAQYRAEHYSVNISTTNTNPASFTQVFDETLSTTIPNWQYQPRQLNINSYAGQTIYVGFRHHQSTDKDRIVIDNVKLYRTDGKSIHDVVYLFEDFQGGIGHPLGEDWMPAGWIKINADGDAFNWYFGVRLNTEGAMRSQSWDATAGALTPDNWLITPPVLLGTVGIEKAPGQFIRIYPNPVTNYLFVEGLDYNKVIIYNLVGKEVAVLNTGSSPLNLPALAPGIYVLAFHNQNQVLHHHRISVK